MQQALAYLDHLTLAGELVEDEDSDPRRSRAGPSSRLVWVLKRPVGRVDPSSSACALKASIIVFLPSMS